MATNRSPRHAQRVTAINIPTTTPLRDGYALRLHLQIVCLIEAPAIDQVSQLSLLLSILATGYDNGTPITKRSDPYSQAITAAVKALHTIQNHADKTGKYTVGQTEAMILRACAAPLDRLFGRIPANKLIEAEAHVRRICSDQLSANDSDSERKAA